MTDIFISYSTKDGSREANELVVGLEAAGWRCWVAPRDMQPAVDHPGQIVGAIRQCRALVLLLTPGANESRDVLRKYNARTTRASSSPRWSSAVAGPLTA
jgi:hypothetical protein